MINPRDIQDMLEMGMSFNNVDFTPDSNREQPNARYDRYQRYIDNIEPLFSEFGDGWGGSTEARDMAMKVCPYEDWME